MTRFPLGLHQPVRFGEALPKAADVVIIGGGIIGIMSAYFLARKGLHPLVLEKGRVAAEQSSRNWGWIRQQGRDPAELPIMMEAIRHWQALTDELPPELGLRQGGVTYLAGSAAEIEGYQSWLDSIEGQGLDSRILSARETAELLPHAQKTWVGALHTPSDLSAEPWQAVPLLAEAAARHGAMIVEECAGRALDMAAGRVAGVVTERGRVQSDQVIVAGGAWSSLFLRRHGVDIPQLSVRATAMATQALPDLFSGAAADGKLAFRRRADGGYTLAPSGFHEVWAGPDALRHLGKYLPQLRIGPFGRRYRPMAPKTYPDAWGTKRRWAEDEVTPFENCRVLNPTPHAGKLREITDAFAAQFPDAGPVRPLASWAGMIDTMPDVVPVVDQVAAIPGLTICTGMCGHGFGIGPGFGRIMSDLVTGDPPGHDLSRFSLSRFTDGSKLTLGPMI